MELLQTLVLQQPLQHLDAVAGEVELLQLLELVEAAHARDLVVLQVEELDVGRGVQSLDGLQLVVVEVEHGEVAAGGQVRDLGDALHGRGSYKGAWQRGTDLVLAVEVGQPLEPGGVLLPRVLHEGPAHTLQHLTIIIDGRQLYICAYRTGDCCE